MTTTSPPPAAGLTPPELAALLRISVDKVHHWIRSGELGAVDVVAQLGRRPRYRILPHHLAAFEASRRGATGTRPPRRKKRSLAIDFYPEEGTGEAAP